MVFIVLGAVKAAKHARNEYNKDKKRNTVIAPVDGSHDMMADRDQAASSQSHQPGTTDWWGTCRAADAPAPTCDASWNHNLVGAWSRDQPVQQRDDDSTARPTSAYASSASASTELSSPIGNSPHERSASLSRLDTVKPRLQGSGDADLRTRPASMDTPSKLRPDDSEGQLPVRQISTGLETIEKSRERDSLETIDIPRRSRTQGAASSASIPLPSRNSDSVVPVRSMDEVEQRAERQRDRAKASVQGSFAEAMQKPRASKPIASNSSSQPSGQTVSALARNASKGLRRRSVQMDEEVQNANGQASEDGDGTLSALSRNASKDHRKRFGRRTDSLPRVQGKDTSAGSISIPRMAPRSALERKASKGPASHEPLMNGSAKLVADEIDVTHNDEQEGQENTRFVDGHPKEARTKVSAFAGAPTKKRNKRLSLANPARGEDMNLTPEDIGASHSSELPPKPLRSSAPVTGSSSMYAAGTMKKRTSRR